MKTSYVVKLLAILVVGTTMMYAQASRTWVSGVGDDANPCSRTAPCKTFAGAISKTATGGEIDALDPGGFGALTITKSITLDGGGGQVASVLVAGTNGIVVAGPAGSNVIIRNLRLNGIKDSGNGGLNGISFISGGDLNVENCVIFGFTQNGVNIALTQNTLGTAHIINTVIKNVSGVGIRATNNQAPAVQVTVSNSTVVPLGSGAGNIGIEAAQHSKVDVSNTLVAHAGGDGMKSDDAASSDANLFVINSEVDFNANGIEGATGGVVVAGGVEGGATGVLFNNTSGGGANYFVYTGTNQNPGSTGTSGTVNPIGRIP